jgi:hypothetical protein
MYLNEKPEFIMYQVQKICTEIGQKGDRSSFTAVMDLIYEHIQDNFEFYFPTEEDDE